jgi:hypothetical protein
MKDKLVVEGQKVWVRRINNRARSFKKDDPQLITEETIGKVGNKYFYLEGYGFKGSKFPVNKFPSFEVSDTCSNYIVYLSPEDIQRERDKANMLAYIKSRVEGLDFDVLKAVYDIMVANIHEGWR